MNQADMAVDQTFQIDQSKDAITQAIKTVRATHEEVDIRRINDGDDAPITDRRTGRRVQLQIPVIFTSVEPVGDQEELVEVCGPEQIAVTRDLSLQGLGIVHDMRLMSDFALVQFDIPGETPINMLFEVRWTTRKTRYSFVSGGRLVGVVVTDSE